jgi:hypothetical protein
MAQSFDNVEKMVNNDDNLLFNILKYTFVMRYISNN